MAQSKVTTGNIFKKILAEGSERGPYIKSRKKGKFTLNTTYNKNYQF